MAFKSFPKPVKAKKVPNRTVSKARAARRRKDEAEKWRIYDLVNERDGCVCRICGLGCWLSGFHHHHINFRSQGGKHTTANVCIVCPRCHELLHNRKMFVSGNADEALTAQESPCPS